MLNTTETNGPLMMCLGTSIIFLLSQWMSFSFNTALNSYKKNRCPLMLFMWVYSVRSISMGKPDWFLDFGQDFAPSCDRAKMWKLVALWCISHSPEHRIGHIHKSKKPLLARVGASFIWSLWERKMNYPICTRVTSSQSSLNHIDFCTNYFSSFSTEW